MVTVNGIKNVITSVLIQTNMISKQIILVTEKHMYLQIMGANISVLFLILFMIRKIFKVKVVDAAILDGDKYILFSLAICNHMSKKGKSMIIKKDDNCLICKRCKAKFVITKEGN